MALSGVDTPHCDCGHAGMGKAWHLHTCRWREHVTGRVWDRTIWLGEADRRPRWLQENGTLLAMCPVRWPSGVHEGSHTCVLPAEHGGMHRCTCAGGFVVEENV